MHGPTYFAETVHSFSKVLRLQHIRSSHYFGDGRLKTALEYP
jgi:hypothetical protein